MTLPSCGLRVRGALASASIAAFAFAGCGGSQSVGSVQRMQTLASATGSECVHPSTQAQTANLPAAGGVSGTISLGSFPKSSNACLEVVVSTGADASNGSDAAAAATRRAVSTDAAATMLPPPIVSVSIADGSPTGLAVLGITLVFPVGPVPPGVYPARISTEISDTNVTVTVDASGHATLGGSAGSSVLALVNAGYTGTITIYPMGTIPPVATPPPSPTPTPSPGPSSTATPVPSATPVATSTPMPLPSATPTASPTPGAFTASVTLTPTQCQQFGNSPSTITFHATPSTSPPPGYTYVYAWGGGAPGSLSVPPPTQTINNPYAGTLTGGSQNDATFTSASWPEGGESGAGGGVSVDLYITDEEYGGLTWVRTENGQYAGANTVIAEGSVTCASEMMRHAP